MLISTSNLQGPVDQLEATLTLVLTKLLIVLSFRESFCEKHSSGLRILSMKKQTSAYYVLGLAGVILSIVAYKSKFWDQQVLYCQSQHRNPRVNCGIEILRFFELLVCRFGRRFHCFLDRSKLFLSTVSKRGTRKKKFLENNSFDTHKTADSFKFK